MEGSNESDYTTRVTKQTPLLTNGRATTRAHSVSSAEMEDFPDTRRDKLMLYQGHQT